MRRPCQSVRRVHTAHTVYCAREEGHRGPCVFADGNGMHIWLDGYEWANLKALLDAIKEANMSAFMNGDWFEQIRLKLSEIYLPNNLPNHPPDTMLKNLYQWWDKPEVKE